MDRTVKILIIAVVVLVGILGVVGGYLLQGSLSSDNKSVNQTVNVTVSNQTTQTKSQSNLISASKAISIVKQNEAQPSKHVRYSAKLVQNGDNPYYQISVYGTDPSSPSYNENIGGARVDAKTGEFLGGMG